MAFCRGEFASIASVQKVVEMMTKKNNPAKTKSAIGKWRAFVADGADLWRWLALKLRQQPAFSRDPRADLLKLAGESVQSASYGLGKRPDQRPRLPLPATLHRLWLADP
jgi:hypothetical protein